MKGLLFGYRWACSQETAEYLDSILLQRLHALAVRLGVHGGEGKGQGGGGVEAEGERKGEGDREFAVVEGTQLYAEGELDPLEEEVRVPIKVCSCVEYFKAITPNARISSLYHEKLGEFLDEGGFVGQLDQDN